MEQKVKDQYCVVDILKFICAIMVVMIHIAPFGTESSIGWANALIQNCISRIAVPFFFVSGGYFLFKKTDYKSFKANPIKSYVIRIIKLYIIWSIIYLPSSVKSIIGNEKGLVTGALEYVRDFFFVGSIAHLWYLNATIVGVILVTFFVYKKMKIRNILLISVLLYFVGLLAQSWFVVISPLSAKIPNLWQVAHKIFDLTITTTRNGLFDGFVFIAIGMLFAFKDIKIGLNKSIIGFFISFALLISEFYIVDSNGYAKGFDMFVFLIPTVFFMFNIAINISLKEGKIYLILRQMSSLIFFTHLAIAGLVTKIFSKLLGFDITTSCLKFVITLVASIIASLIIIKLSSYKPFKWLKMIY